jgi:hypothetical protein
MGRGRMTVRPPRSMAAAASKLFLFGGFSDFVKESRYYNDMFVFDIESSHWSEQPCAVKPFKHTLYISLVVIYR